MSSTSPSVVLYSSQGVELDITPGTAVSGINGILMEGTDGTNARTILTDASGRQIVIGAAATGTAVTGAPVLVGGSNGTNTYQFLTDSSGRLFVNQGTPNTLANAWPVELTDGYGNLFGEPNNPITVTGSIMVANNSVGYPATTPPTEATYVGALVTTAMESGLTSGDMYPFNLTTTGLLRIDGSYPAGTANATAADVSNSGGYVTTAAPTYTTGLLEPLSLDTSGNLRVLANQGTSPWVVSGTVAVSSVAGTVAVTQSTSPWVVSASGNFNNASVGPTASAPPADATYTGALVTTAMESGLTSGDMYPLNMTTTGLLRIDGAYPSGTATATAVDMSQVGGLATTAAPTYTTATLNPLSLDTSGNLRVTGSFNNSSVGPTASAPPADATYAGALVTTAAESGLTSGDMYPLNLTTTGMLRIDGHYPLATAVATAVDMGQVGGVVTTAAPTYTTATVNALSLDTSGNLRVTAVTNKAGTANVTSVAVTASTATSLLAANAARLFGSLYNNTNKNVYVLLGGGTASATNFSIVLMTNSYWELPVDWTGAVSEFAPSGASGAILCTELTA